jgi:Ca2+-binding RTX toxin-like protein
VYKLGDGLDTLIDAGGNDTVRFGPGLSLDNVALRLTTDNGVLTAHVRILDAEGCEQPDQGFDFVMDHDSTGKPVSPIEVFQFADGSTKTFADVQIKTVLTNGVHGVTAITTGRDDDIITAGNNQHNTIDSGSGNDTVYAFNQGDTISGGGGNDVLVGGNGDDAIDGGCGTDILAGGHGDDVLRDLGDDGGNVLLGSYGNDTIVAGSNDDFIAGGRDSDTISAGGGANVIAYNKNDGADTITPSAGAQNTLSLGGGISDRDLALRKAGNDLVLEMGVKNEITFKDWYLSPGNRNFVNLQVIEDASNDYKPDSANTLFNKRVVDFDFLKLVGEFDQALATTSALTSWSLMNGMLDAYLSGSDTKAIGGDLAYQYGTKNGSADVGIDSGIETLKQHGFGSHAHAFNQAGVAFPGELRVA